MRCLVISDIHDGPDPRTCFSRALSRGAARPWRIDRLRIGELLPAPVEPGAALHQCLISGGFQEAAGRLAAREGGYDIAIGYSAGGTILWHAVNRGLELGSLLCVSSTRLRLETEPLRIPVLTLFAADDPNRPDANWAQALRVTYALVPDAGHAFYADPDAVAWRDALAMLEPAVKGTTPWSA